jgi:hypothetical protein
MESYLEYEKNIFSWVKPKEAVWRMKKELQDTAENTWEAMDEEKATGAREIC